MYMYVLIMLVNCEIHVVYMYIHSSGIMIRVVSCFWNLLLHVHMHVHVCAVLCNTNQ